MTHYSTVALPGNPDMSQYLCDYKIMPVEICVIKKIVSPKCLLLPHDVLKSHHVTY
jgi:hypothetical protein